MTVKQRYERFVGYQWLHIMGTMLIVASGYFISSDKNFDRYRKGIYYHIRFSFQILNLVMTNFYTLLVAYSRFGQLYKLSCQCCIF